MHPLDSHFLTVLSKIVGWGYFVAWSVSFYPQIVENYMRKHVKGLSFDYVLYNFTGFLCYSIYNCFLYWIPVFQQEYIKVHGPPIPVHLNDCVFALHALFFTLITIAQIFIYPHGDNKLSIVSIILSIAGWISIIVITIVCAKHKLTWLFYIEYLSYVKLAITLIKYIPQVYLNYRRKSTVGWSIGNTLLDFTGGVLSFFQMFIDSINAGNWREFYGDPAKLGLALLSIFFDVVIGIQHYICYREARVLDPLFKSQEKGYTPINISFSRNNSKYLATLGGK
eukprot:TRINITY_DN13885_c0_g1_i1.p1 TRINITY_DN13885_c0_g1~~TRINITY_DN13885_c0_g1_i1.p1  ORF type:complete len:281 (-),score=16.45 TRINITY_DN13885_c0_g1_i1:46-888(-)